MNMIDIAIRYCPQFIDCNVDDDDKFVDGNGNGNGDWNCNFVWQFVDDDDDDDDGNVETVNNFFVANIARGLVVVVVVWRFVLFSMLSLSLSL